MYLNQVSRYKDNTPSYPSNYQNPAKRITLVTNILIEYGTIYYEASCSTAHVEEN